MREFVQLRCRNELNRLQEIKTQWLTIEGKYVENLIYDWTLPVITRDN